MSRLRRAEPAEVGLGVDLPRALDEAVAQQLDATGIPGAAVLVARRGAVVHHGCYGFAQDHDAGGLLPRPRAVGSRTLFDVASITKVVATTAVVMALLERGALALDDLVERHLPRPGRLGPHVRIAHLLEHRAGLPAWEPLYLRADGPEAAVERICAHEPHGVGRARVYSDLGMALLGSVAEHAGDAPLEELVRRFVTAPLGLDATVYRPRASRPSRCAATSTGNPTEQRMVADGGWQAGARTGPARGWRSRTLVGEVNDGNAAHAFDGVAGHAGLFATAEDLAVLGQTLLGGGRCGDVEVWHPRTVARFTGAGTEPGQGLGFWRRRLSALGAADPISDDSYGHRGFTGCELVVCPGWDLVLVLLSNRLHTEADPPTDDAPLWRAVLRVVASSLGRRSPSAGATPGSARAGPAAGRS